MTVSSTSPIAIYDCTGGTGYTYPFRIFEDSDLVVVYNDGAGIDTTLALDVDYTVSDAGDPDGGTVTTVSTYTSGTITLRRELPYTQEIDLEDYGPLPSSLIEEIADRLVMLLQQLELEALGGASSITAGQIKILYESNNNTNAFTDTEKTKLTNVEPAADVTDATNVDAAGAVMDGDFTDDGIMVRSGGAGAYGTVPTTTYLQDADSDDNYYARRNGAWEYFIPGLKWETIP